MYDTFAVPEGGFRFAKGVYQYSSGVSALPGYAIEHVRLQRLLPLDAFFAMLPGWLEFQKRPAAALCSIELRSPKPMDDADFTALNKSYVRGLNDIGIRFETENPIARTNVVPQFGAPDAVSVHAFGYTLKETEGAGGIDFICAGSAESPEGTANYIDNAIAYRDTSPEGLQKKSAFVLDEMERRMASFGRGWKDATVADVYTAYDFHHLVEANFVPRSAQQAGLTWHPAFPPVASLDFEMDVRGVSRERLIRRA